MDEGHWGKLGLIDNHYRLKVSPQTFIKSCIKSPEILIPTVKALADGAFANWLGHEGRALRSKINALMKAKGQRELPPPLSIL